MAFHPCFLSASCFLVMEVGTLVGDGAPATTAVTAKRLKRAMGVVLCFKPTACVWLGLTAVDLLGGMLPCTTCSDTGI